MSKVTAWTELGVAALVGIVTAVKFSGIRRQTREMYTSLTELDDMVGDLSDEELEARI